MGSSVRPLLIPTIGIRVTGGDFFSGCMLDELLGLFRICLETSCFSFDRSRGLKFQFEVLVAFVQLMPPTPASPTPAPLRACRHSSDSKHKRISRNANFWFIFNLKRWVFVVN